MKKTRWMIPVAILAMVSMAGAVQYEWDGSVEPSAAVPVWSMDFTGGTYTQNGDGTGTISTAPSDTSHRNYKLNNLDRWNHDPTENGVSVVEYRMKVVAQDDTEGTTHVCMFAAGSDDRIFTMLHSTNQVIDYQASEDGWDWIPVDSSVYHDYKLVIAPDGQSADFYIDDVWKTNYTGYVATGYEFLHMGDWSTVAGGTSTWDYVQWENGVIIPSGTIVGSDVQPAQGIGFPSEKNRPYQLEYASDLVLSNWTDQGTSIIGNGTTNFGFASKAEDNPEAQRFYRVVSP